MVLEICAGGYGAAGARGGSTRGTERVVGWWKFPMCFPSKLSWVQIPSPAPNQDVKRDVLRIRDEGLERRVLPSPFLYLMKVG